jgi:hypothetical protein
MKRWTKCGGLNFGSGAGRSCRRCAKANGSGAKIWRTCLGHGSKAFAKVFQKAKVIVPSLEAYE